MGDSDISSGVIKKERRPMRVHSLLKGLFADDEIHGGEDLQGHEMRCRLVQNEFDKLTFS